MSIINRVRILTSNCIIKLKFIADSSCPHSEGGQRSVAGTEKKKKLHQRDNADIFFISY